MMMVRKSKGLGERHQKILDFLGEYQRENKYPPSIREIGEKTGISSTSVVNYYLDQLEKMGKIERDRKISRGVRVSTPNGSLDMTGQGGAHWGCRVGFSSFQLETNDCLKLLCHFSTPSGFSGRFRGRPPTVSSCGLWNSLPSKPQPVTV